MPFSFIDVESQKSRRIYFLFATLVIFYFFGFLALYLSYSAYDYFRYSKLRIPPVPTGFSSRDRDHFWNLIYAKNYRDIPSPNIGNILPNRKNLISLLLLAFLTALLHWFFSTYNLLNRILKILNARLLDHQDLYHQTFNNIIEEIKVATGGRFPITPYVINSHYLNAFAIADFKGNGVIGVTEGLLIKLTRRQLEAVVAHEASHLLWGDSLLSTVTTSIVSVYSALFRTISRRFRNPLTVLVISILHLLSLLLNSWISREKEYRADATAVRLTREPLGLAEALHLISRGWRGQYLAAEELSPIFITSPRLQKWDEKEGLTADLFATHPPIEKRINVLLEMAHSNLLLLEKSAQGRSPQKEVVAISSSGSKQSWFVCDNDGKWQGPFGQQQLSGLGWLLPTSWAKLENNQEVKPAYEFKELSAIFRQGNSVSSGSFNCPVCHQGLEQIYYEGVMASRCRFCSGHLVREDQVPRICVRQEMVFSEELKKMANLIKSSQQLSRPFTQKNNSVFTCPQCGRAMIRKGYAALYPHWLEIDTCSSCGSLWFDKNELELVQYLTEKNVRS
ncbi:MAG: zinc metalloprotease HtpX [Elusimicrobiota bacterium]